MLLTNWNPMNLESLPLMHPNKFSHLHTLIFACIYKHNAHPCFIPKVQQFFPHVVFSELCYISKDSPARNLLEQDGKTG